ncbi:P60-like protein [Pseudovirgaria hyperparasitica]|uniref:Ribosome biogenesis protein NOP53 n=1 Tax=Pseudovirgaria hyperparasitica TaxID=470096 RepID=A0A6A6VY28_9PEZI|nr:P60-like protein [Pseudovirgaria hyperparasitica]KAF2754604.1 P60-like protein [Pseudovirgaria hyperparasitica]
MSETAKSAPAQYKQPSRKGKKAWRKNVDVTEVNEGLKNLRDELILGGVVAEKSADDLFAVDTAGSATIQKSYNKKNKPLRADEILAQRSAIPAVSSRKRLSDGDSQSSNKRRKNGVSHKEYDRLRSIAYGGDAVNKDVVEVHGAAYDPWAPTENQVDPRFNFLEEKKARVEPKSLKEAPISLTKSGKAVPAVRKPKAGRSYNPQVDDWEALLTKLGGEEVEAEKKRLTTAKEEAERMEKALATAAEPDPVTDDEDGFESEWEGIQSEAEDETLKQKRPQRKTQAERNKINRRKEAEALLRHEKKQLEKEKQVAKIKIFAQELARKENARKVALAVQAPEDVDSDSSDEELRRKRLGKIRVPEAPLEVLLTEDLTDSLRKLKPEGNLLNDRFRNMMVNGKIESRRRISQPKKRKVALTEKWSYKDWKLN